MNLATLEITGGYNSCLEYWVELEGTHECEGWHEAESVRDALDKADVFLIGRNLSRQGRAWKFDRYRGLFLVDVRVIDEVVS